MHAGQGAEQGAAEQHVAMSPGAGGDRGWQFTDVQKKHSSPPAGNFRSTETMKLAAGRKGA